ncbi:hypothetical protein L0664_17355 [Octadecabacter sp. G9-8]|uniref:Glycosyl transferase CAP10 domain-containing protein n=1 Tax=Octadecabacter dasysiphoniae TaxID=2909341 RepID=A0ABS9D3F5_9RHOB|nr:glycosyl transferase family 90 [Octadecabacter dasysiphoniae]MCF2872838.1 hypothetical protein [Octadecabacter dasysiphoniae]
MPNSAPPRVFAIGLPHSGGAAVAALFEGNGYAWAHHKGGKLAQSMAYARASGTAPLSQWLKFVGFSGLHRTNKRHLPPLVIQDHLEFLLTRFPDAYFIRTQRDPADWIAARFWAEDGDHRIAAAWHAGVSEAALPAHWIDEDAAHQAACARLFGQNPRYIDFNVTSEPIEKLIDFLSADFTLTNSAPTPDMTVSAEQIDGVVNFLGAQPAASSPPPADMTFAHEVAAFAAAKTGHSGKRKGLSGTAVTWERDRTITDRFANPVALHQAAADMPFHLTPDSNGFERAQGTLNELMRYGAQPPLHIDMMDARFIGTPTRRNPPHRTVAYNRRKGAKNLTLWPLPGYHTLAPTGQAGGFAHDTIPFEDKEDRCVWLGNMTGRMSDVLTPEGRPLRGVYNIRDQAETLRDDSPDWAGVVADLLCVPRYNIVKTYRDHPDFEVGLVLRGRWKRLAQTPAFADLCHPKRPRTWFHQFRYILSLAGNDTGSNFLSAASSNALILKEEDGWELFYTDAFKPWVHYVPLIEGAQDVEEKLAWARAHPDKCKAMVTAAKALFDAFANPNNRDAILRQITSKLNADLG